MSALPAPDDGPQDNGYDPEYAWNGGVDPFDNLEFRGGEPWERLPNVKSLVEQFLADSSADGYEAIFDESLFVPPRTFVERFQQSLYTIARTGTQVPHVFDSAVIDRDRECIYVLVFSFDPASDSFCLPTGVLCSQRSWGLVQMNPVEQVWVERPPGGAGLVAEFGLTDGQPPCFRRVIPFFHESSVHVALEHVEDVGELVRGARRSDQGGYLERLPASVITASALSQIAQTGAFIQGIRELQVDSDRLSIVAAVTDVPVPGAGETLVIAEPREERSYCFDVRGGCPQLRL